MKTYYKGIIKLQSKSETKKFEVFDSMTEYYQDNLVHEAKIALTNNFGPVKMKQWIKLWWK